MEENLEVISASVTDRGLSDKRPQNEDSYLELGRFGIFAVADGVGGAQAGDVASQMAVEILGEAFSNRPANSDAEVVMRVAIERANSAIYQMSHDLAQLATMATTIVALHISGNIATLGHVGDSRIYRIDSSGNITQETDDHSVVAEEVRAGRMTAEQAAVHPSRNVISRALGAESTVQIDLKTIMVEPGTSFVLCSDGITRHIDDWELEGIIRSEPDLGEVCRKLKQLCYDRGAEDNLTAVVLKVSGDASPIVNELPPIAVSEPDEEDTVATVRSPFDETAEPLNVAPPEELLLPVPFPVAPESYTEDAAEADDVLELAPETPTLAPASADEPFELEVPEREPVISEPALVEPVPVVSTGSQVPEPAFVTERSAPDSDLSFGKYSEPASRTGVFGSFLSSLLLLVIGGLLGGAGMYFLFQPKTAAPANVQPTPILEPKASPQFSSFEQLRRDVDRDPVKYLEANKAYESDADAADFYLKGRALLRTGDFFGAKQSFQEAKKRLRPDSDDAATLETEIALALAVIGNPPASESFQKDLHDWSNAGVANTDPNTSIAAPGNANSNANSNR